MKDKKLSKAESTINELGSRKTAAIIFKYIFYGFIFAVAAWVAVHILAVLGLFIAIGFLIWCFLIRKENNFKQICLVCLAIIVLSIFSVGVVYLEARILLSFGFPKSPKTVEFVIPAKSQRRIGEIFPLEIRLTGIKVPINAVQADIGFDPAQLTVVDVSTKDSFAGIFIQKEINNDGGWVRLTGGLPNPGYFSDRGLFGTIFFQAKTSGLTEIRYLFSSMVLANDGRGSNVLKSFPSMSYLIIPDRLTPTELKDQEKLLTSAAPVLGAHTEIGDSGKGVELSFIESAPKVPIVKDLPAGRQEKVLGAQTSSEDEKPGFFGQAVNFLSAFDNFILKLFKLLK